MGNFGGHALPGSFFLIFAVWWTFKIFQRYYQSLRKGGKPFVSSLTFPCDCCCGRLKTWEVEGFVKIFFTIIGFALEVFTAHNGGRFSYLGNGQHATMFFFFGISGFIDILVHHRVPLPRGIEYVAAMQAVLVELLLFVFHLHARASLDVLVHHLLLFAIFMTFVSAFAELCWRQSVLAALARAYFLFLQGTWFWHIAFILYPPFDSSFKWDLENHDHMMVVTMLFAWHMGGIFICMLVIGAIIGWIYQCRGDFVTGTVSDGAVHLDVLKKRTNGAARYTDELDDSNSEVEFSKPFNTKP